MSPWVLRGLRDGVVTTRWPARPDPYAEDWRGPATIVGSPRGAAGGRPPGQILPDGDIAAICPTGAISIGPSHQVTLDQGRCVLCGQCVAQRPDLFTWSRGAQVATLTRARLVVPMAESDEELAKVRAALAARTAALRRSVHLRHVDAGSDGAEEQEIAALLNPVYDIHRLGIFLTATPRHADVLLVTGAGAAGMELPLLETYAGMPDPKVVIAVGTDAVSGGLLAGEADTGEQGNTGEQGASGIGDLVPVDVWVPGSPPPPFSILHALLVAIGKLAAGPAGGKR
jgi:Ni,Fe-hydrogenase III small subunit/ferredoxin